MYGCNSCRPLNTTLFASSGSSLAKVACVRYSFACVVGFHLNRAVASFPDKTKSLTPDSGACH